MLTNCYILLKLIIKSIQAIYILIKKGTYLGVLNNTSYKF